jgi:hypothetical protein
MFEYLHHQCVFNHGSLANSSYTGTLTHTDVWFALFIKIA